MPSLSKRQAAERLNASTRTLDRLRATNQGPNYHRVGNRIRYTSEDLDAWIAANTIDPAKEPAE